MGVFSKFLRFCIQDPSQAILVLQNIDVTRQDQLLTFRDPLKRTSLWYASYHGHHQLVDALIRAGADVNAPMSDQFLPIYVAAYYGHHLVVELLLAAGANPNSSCKSGASPLSIASQHGFPLVVQMLLPYRGLNVPDERGYLPLICASENGHISIVNILLAAGVDPNKYDLRGITPLQAASLFGRDQIVDILIAAGAAVNDRVAKANLRYPDGATPIFVASKGGYYFIVQRLLTNGANPNIPTLDMNTSLMAALQSNHHSVVTLLLDHGADSNVTDSNGMTPLHWISEQGHHQLAERLLGVPGTNVNATTNNGKTALLIAAEKNHPQVVDVLLRVGADPNITGWNGMTPLHWVSQQGHHHLAERLLGVAGIDVNATTNDGKTALLIAAENNHPQVVDVLLRAGANSNIAGENGMTPLHWVCYHGIHRLVEAFLAAGADKNALSRGDYNCGRTPLSEATRAGHLRIIQILLAAGADLTFARMEALLGVAVEHGHHQIVDFFLEQGANPNGCFLHAVYCGSELSLEKLLAFGADPMAIGSNGENAIDMAIMLSRSPSAVELLLAAGVHPQLSKQVNCGSDWEAKLFLPRRVKIAKLLLYAGADPSNLRNMLCFCMHRDSGIYFAKILSNPLSESTRTAFQRRQSQLVAFLTELKRYKGIRRNLPTFKDWLRNEAPFHPVLIKYQISVACQVALFVNQGLEPDTLEILTLADLTDAMKENDPPIPTLRLRQLFKDLKETKVDASILSLEELLASVSVLDAIYPKSEPSKDIAESFDVKYQVELSMALQSSRDAGESADQEQARVNERLQRLALMIAKPHPPVDATGNCFFSTLAFLLYGNASYYHRVRVEIVNWFRENGNQANLLPFLGERSLNAYCDLMIQNREWVDHIIIQASADFYQRTIFILSSFASERCHCRIHPRNASANPEPELQLLHWVERHYEPLVPLMNHPLSPRPTSGLASSFSGNPPSTQSSRLIPSTEIKYAFDEASKLGSGQFGTVTRGFYKGTPVALKMVKLSAECEEPHEELGRVLGFIREANVMSLLPSEYLVKLLGVCFEPPMLVMELMTGGSLFDLLHKNSSVDLSWSQKWHILYQIGQGISFLHRCSMTHRDLKPANILLSKDYQQVKLGDFGFSKKVDIAGLLQTATRAGTVLYMSPELLSAIRPLNGFACDIYAFGIILWEVGYRRIPYLGGGSIPEFIHQVTHEKLRPAISPHPELKQEFHDLMIRCWDHHADRRPSISLVLEDLRLCEGDSRQSNSSQPPPMNYDDDYLLSFRMFFTANGEKIDGDSGCVPAILDARPEAFVPAVFVDPQPFSVELWLTNLKLSEYIPVFLEHEITTVFRLKGLSNDVLREEFGIKKFGHRFEILEAIKQLERRT